MSITRIRLRVPGSTSNLGPGFDCIGLAVGLYNDYLFECIENGFEIAFEGEGAEVLAKGESRTYRSLAHACSALGIETPAVRIVQHNAVPLARGLGGSATAVLAGIVAGYLFAGHDWNPTSVLDLAIQVENHPDNLTPSLLGGLTTSLVIDGHAPFVRVVPPPDLTTVTLIPDRGMETGSARQVLPTHYSRQDMVFNLRGSAMIMAALASNQLDHLALAMQDRLHQPHRVPLLPGMMEIIEAAVGAGSPGAALSGAGSGIFAFAYKDNERRIGAAMEAVAARHGMNSYCLYLPIDNTGLQVLEVG